MAEHLSRSFFETELHGLAEAYAREVDVQKVHTEVMLRGGVTLRAEGRIACSDAFIIVDYKSGSQVRRAVLPYASIVGIGFAPDQGGGSVGFAR